MHISIPASGAMEFITNTQVSPSVSKVSIKICYVGENRNGTYFSKEVLTEMGRKVGGCPIVGYYNESTQDFEGHNRSIQLGGGDVKFVDMTKPYGFVPENPKVWFQVFNDDGVPHEYLCTEGWLWTKVYEEAQRIIKHGNNQSMEIDGDGHWAESENGDNLIFIYSEALIDKLCVLGEGVEPCFEGAQIKDKFELHEQFEALKQDMYAMMNEFKEALKGGETKVFTTYAVTIGDALWTALYSHLNAEGYSIRGVMTEGEQKFAIVQKSGDEKLYRMNFAFENDTLDAADEMSEFAADAVELQFSIEDNANFKKKEEENPEEGKDGKEDNPDSEEDSEDGDKGKKKKDYNLDEIPEYVKLKQNYEALVAENTALKAFKVAAERVEKQAMIDSFYMLSDEDKKDCVANIDTYSVEDIEAKLSIICVRNKVSFAQEDDNNLGGVPNMFSLNNNGGNDDSDAPAWVKAVRQTQKNKEDF